MSQESMVALQADGDRVLQIPRVLYSAAVAYQYHATGRHKKEQKKDNLGYVIHPGCVPLCVQVDPFVEGSDKTAAPSSLPAMSTVETWLNR